MFWGFAVIPPSESLFLTPSPDFKKHTQKIRTQVKTEWRSVTEIVVV